jgi:hypothetical protein
MNGEVVVKILKTNQLRTVTKFIVPDWAVYVVDSGIGLSYRPARLYSLAGRYDDSMSELTL